MKLGSFAQIIPMHFPSLTCPWRIAGEMCKHNLHLACSVANTSCLHLACILSSGNCSGCADIFAVQPSPTGYFVDLSLRYLFPPFLLRSRSSQVSTLPAFENICHSHNPHCRNRAPGPSPALKGCVSAALCPYVEHQSRQQFLPG